MKNTIFCTLLFLGATACGGRQGASVAVAAEEAIPVEAAQCETTENAPLCGAYGKPRALTPVEAELFKTATADLDGVAYTPNSVATQVVAGTNYKFFCTAKTITLSPQHYKAEVIVFAPLPHTKELPRITGITRTVEKE